jgi:hypothetical protein
MKPHRLTVTLGQKISLPYLHSENHKGSMGKKPVSQADPQSFLNSTQARIYLKLPQKTLMCSHICLVKALELLTLTKCTAVFFQLSPSSNILTAATPLKYPHLLLLKPQI